MSVIAVIMGLRHIVAYLYQVDRAYKPISESLAEEAAKRLVILDRVNLAPGGFQYCRQLDSA